MQPRSDSEINNLFEAYLPKLVQLADRRIQERLIPKFDSEDIAQTVMRSVYRRIREGKFSFDDDAEFWRLLVTIARRKISNKVRHYKTQSRSIDGEVSDVADFLRSRPEPTPGEASAFNESLGKLCQNLDDVQREVFKLRMEGYDYHEIADLIGMSERNVRRKMDVIKLKVREIFIGDKYDESSPDNSTL